MVVKRISVNVRSSLSLPLSGSQSLSFDMQRRPPKVQELRNQKEYPQHGQDQKLKVLPRFELGLPEYLTNQNPE